MKKFSLLLLSLMFVLNASATIYYVNISTGNDANTGTSWSTCFRTVTRALTAANASTASEVDIWIAGGTYTPLDGLTTFPSDRSDTAFAFYRGDGIGKALKVYGGFAGTESSLAARDTSHTTYLDGILSAGNSYHVAVIAGLAASADSVVLDGLTISNGIATNQYYKVYNGSNIYQYNGGGIVIVNNASSKIAMHNCTFYSNKTIGYISTSGSFTIAGLGGAAYITSPCYFDGCTFNSNGNLGYNRGASGGAAIGGAIYVNAANIVVRNSSFNDNYAVGGDPASSWSYSTSGGVGMGGAICFNRSARSLVENCYFSTNYSQGGQGAYSGGGSVYANNFGGGICNLYSGTTMLNCHFKSNKSVTNGDVCGGGAIANLASTGYNSNCVFDSNIAKFGGAIFDSVSTDTFNAVTFKNNFNAGLGAALYELRSQNLFTNCTLTNNGHEFAYYYGNGGAVANARGSNTKFYHCVIDSNYGFGIYNQNSTLQVLSSSFLGNRGNGLYTTGSRSIVDSCLFDGNSSSGGAAIYVLDSSISPTHCIFSNNNGDQGGAIHVGSYSSSNNRFKSDGNVFYKNYSNTGGAIYLEICPSCTDTLLNNIFIQNYAYENRYGGGALLLKGGRNYVYNNTFYKDSASGYGGAIRMDGTGNTTKIANNIFYKSKAIGTTTDTSIVGTGSFLFYNNIHTGTNPFFRDSVNLKGADSTWGTADDGLQLQPCSPGVDAGNNAYVVYGENTDITNRARIVNTTVDIGAYEAVSIGAISGTPLLCVGSSATFTDTSRGGTWSSSDTAVLTVTSAGVVRAVSLGTAVISYTISTSCGTRSTGYLVSTENRVSAIVGPDTLCRYSTIRLTDSMAGGTWRSSTSTIATVDSTGLVTGISRGVDTIIYSFTNSCGVTRASKLIYVEAPASAIVGPDSVCVGASFTFSDTAAGGTWRSAMTSIATISATGAGRAVSPGIDTIFYNVTNSCGASSEYKLLIVQRRAAAIVAADSICMSSGTISFTDSATGGTWRVSDTSVLRPTSISGSYTIVRAGVDTIFYTLVNACGTSSAYRRITFVSPSSGTIIGTASHCIGDTTILADSVVGGRWSSSTTSVATVNTIGKVTCVAAGTSTISYTISNICGTFAATLLVTVSGVPTAAVLSGPDVVCMSGSGVTLTASVAGGTWTASNSNARITGSSGYIVGLIPGVDTITYTIVTPCGTASSQKVITVVASPTAALITGLDSVCQTATITLFTSAGGGTWSATTGRASVSAAGLVTGINPGVDTIVYTLSNPCGATRSLYPIRVHSTGYCDSVTSVPTINTTVNVFDVYPNPAYHSITIHIASDRNEAAMITITNVLGERVTEWTVISNTPTERELNLPVGMYVLTAHINNMSYVRRLVVIE